jgi:hypothetical protein
VELNKKVSEKKYQSYVEGRLMKNLLSNCQNQAQIHSSINQNTSFNYTQSNMILQKKSNILQSVSPGKRASPKG